ncbi:unnamed protein product [Aureobasidium mustum]|uniref:Fe2OG dioxygenase domain-containing protein n=1 Tax=Aureobasidium mustum TaxID=2773714 RepID=A0A9N8PMQ5_9PEZI|nr:unnamed protein product [Aureobasidium mustum]
MASHLDAHARPPEDLHPDLFDTQRRNLSAYQDRNLFQQAPPDDITTVYSRFLGKPVTTLPPSIESAIIYEHPDAPDIQLALLDKLLHRDLSNPSHNTNLHMHYDMTYPHDSDGTTTSFFGSEAGNISHQPKDPSIHKPLPMTSCLNRKLRWVTIGGQYDWTQKVYPASAPPPFPEDVAALVEGLFPSMKAQAAIVNLYTPSDTLSLHRDVSEECDRPLLTDADKTATNTQESEDGQDKTRNASTSIHYLLTPESPMGAFHRNRGRTVHTLHRGRGRYVIIHADEVMPEYDSHSGIRSKARVETFIVGQNVEKGERLQWIVDGGKYKKDPANNEGLLISETVVPGFEYSDHDFMRIERLEALVTKEQANEMRWMLRKDDKPV